MSVVQVVISGNGRVLLSCLLVETLLSREMESGVYAWYARVPSSSNPAGAPSRGLNLDSFELGTPLHSIESSVASTMEFISKGLEKNGG